MSVTKTNTRTPSGTIFLAGFSSKNKGGHTHAIELSSIRTPAVPSEPLEISRRYLPVDASRWQRYLTPVGIPIVEKSTSEIRSRVCVIFYYHGRDHSK